MPRLEVGPPRTPAGRWRPTAAGMVLRTAARNTGCSSALFTMSVAIQVRMRPRPTVHPEVAATSARRVFRERLDPSLGRVGRARLPGMCATAAIGRHDEAVAPAGDQGAAGTPVDRAPHTPSRVPTLDDLLERGRVDRPDEPGRRDGRRLANHPRPIRPYRGHDCRRWAAWSAGPVGGRPASQAEASGPHSAATARAARRPRARPGRAWRPSRRAGRATPGADAHAGRPR